jgi:hypothetical protein
MTLFANATTPTKAALAAALALGASALFLLVASNVLLLGLRLHDGGFHWVSVLNGFHDCRSTERMPLPEMFCNPLSGRFDDAVTGALIVGKRPF